MSARMDWLELLARIVRGMPNLADAACRGRHELFDADESADPDEAAERHARAVALCQRCPALAECRSWVDNLPPPRRPSGVVAGRLPDGTGQRGVA